ncbi:MAG: hypothetical protein NWE92_07145 [Candidatus Bathyarchaeota archaeon]|nr:hypothetical protein [Candidatus Bathyarchaeota archaeon]
MSTTKEKNRALVYKALTDPAFRKQLSTQPAKALGVSTLSPEKEVMIKKALSAINELESKIGSIADELLCANGGPCGIAKLDVAKRR